MQTKKTADRQTDRQTHIYKIQNVDRNVCSKIQYIHFNFLAKLLQKPAWKISILRKQYIKKIWKNSEIKIIKLLSYVIRFIN